MARYPLFPARVPFVNADGTLTNAAVQALAQLARLLGGAAGTLPDVLDTVLANGSAAAPSLRFEGDVDTGLFLVEEGAVGITANGVQSVQFDGSGLKVVGLDPDAFLYQADGYLAAAIATDGELLIGATGSYPAVGSLLGAPNRTSVSYASGDLVIDISSSYAGQSSITTLGEVAEGEWKAEAIAPAYGGTGLTAYAAGDVLYATGTAALDRLAAVAEGNVLKSGATPSWGKVDLAEDVSGSLAVDSLDGGAGASVSTFWRGDGAWADPLASTPVLAGGTYTPAVTGVANIDSASAYVCQWLRVGDIVTVSGRLAAEPASLSANTEVGISLPVGSSFAGVGDCAGTGACQWVTGQAAGISADVTNDRAAMRWVAGFDTPLEMYFVFTYRII